MKIFGRHIDWRIKDIIIKGPSFCHVDRIRQFIHEIEDITDGNQKWHGAIPSFRMIAEIRMYDGSGIELFSHSDDDAIRINLLPRAWIKKYFVAASCSWNLLDIIISGMNDRRLISIPHHINSQFVLDNIISVLIRRVDVISIENARVLGSIKI